MISIANSIEIARPVARVFEFVADARNNPQWMPVQKVYNVSEGIIGVGTTFKQEFVLMGTSYELDGTITEFEPAKKIAFVYKAQVFTWQGHYLLESVTDDTRLSARGNINLSGALKMMEPMLAPKIRKLVNDTAPNLKKILENE